MVSDVKILSIKPMSNWGGICITAIDTEKVTHCENYGNGNIDFHTTKIRYGKNDSPYFLRNGRREYLKDYLMV